MQDDDKILYTAVGKVVENVRKSNGTKFTLFCYENDIPKSSLYDMEHGNKQSYFSKVFKVVKALGISFTEFAELLEKELPDDFMNQP